MAEVLLPTNIKKSFYRFKRPHRRPQCKIVHSCSLCIDFVSELKSKEKKTQGQSVNVKSESYFILESPLGK